MQITCPECGCPYDASSPYCPECGYPTEATQPAGQVTITKCPNCGAPVGSGASCEYCGSAYPRIVQQGPQQVIINNQQDNTSAVVGAFLGGLVGGALSDR